eukprot:CAMPEP_0204579560 /NCGR_PEP_ID=MMETSP0661-20131031/43564_1 /ASSEMBLY_ACC=CAM_ASM_000606 /TAXON_ID=109239 /ORGANISM="Alexandrium margalefi, Strain AMGDE01CS-322" /LENGTH=52 /DNA_ID=CAMNT_0051588585 /DNA_START=198 /DNA_END=356 /DNA_ORIENTATION=-
MRSWRQRLGGIRGAGRAHVLARDEAELVQDEHAQVRLTQLAPTSGTVRWCVP